MGAIKLTVNVLMIPMKLYLKYLVLRASVKDIVWHFMFLNNSDDIMFKKKYAGCHTKAGRLT